MTPSSPKSPTTVDELRDIMTAAQALRFVLAKVELRAAKIIWNTEAPNRTHVISAIMAASREFAKAVEKSTESTTSEHTHKTPPKPGHGPDCKQGFHEEFGICVPDDN